MRTPTTARDDHSALLVSGSQKSGEQLKSMLDGSGCRAVGVLSGGDEARRALLSLDVDLLVINTPLANEFGHELAVDAADKGVGVLLLVKSEIAEEVRAKVAPSGVPVLAKPISRERLHEALALLGTFLMRLRKTEDESRRLRAKLEEVKAVCRAKCLLVERRGMTEPEAHRLIEKAAMDRRVTRRAVAEEIIGELGDE